MNDIIASARREARRRAKADGGSLQAHLDTIAREAGRSRWRTFLDDPAQVAENVLDRLVREAQEDGYDGLEIEAGSIVPAELGPMLVKAFRTVNGELRLDLFRLSWDDGLYLAPSIIILINLVGLLYLHNRMMFVLQFSGACLTNGFFFNSYNSNVSNHNNVLFDILSYSQKRNATENSFLPLYNYQLHYSQALANDIVIF